MVINMSWTPSKPFLTMYFVTPPGGGVTFPVVSHIRILHASEHEINLKLEET